MANSVFRPKKCPICGNTPLRGPFEISGDSRLTVWFSWKAYARVFAYLCSQCGHVLSFTDQHGRSELERTSQKR